MIQRIVYTLIAVAVAWPAGAQTGVEVLKQIPYKIVQGSEVRAAVREECKLDSRVPEFISSFADDVQLVDKLGSGTVLDIAITEVHAPGGGAFSGPKWITVAGELRKGKSVTGSFRAKRFSTGGAFGAFKNTCSILGRTARAVGNDIATWLKSPAKDSRLGDAR